VVDVVLRGQLFIACLCGVYSAVYDFVCHFIGSGQTKKWAYCTTFAQFPSLGGLSNPDLPIPLLRNSLGPDEQRKILGCVFNAE